MTMLFPRYFRAKSSNTSQARKRYKPLRQSRKIVSVIALPRKISRAYMRLSVSPLAIKPASFQAAREANINKAAGTSGTQGEKVLARLALVSPKSPPRGGCMRAARQLLARSPRMRSSKPHHLKAANLRSEDRDMLAGTPRSCAHRYANYRG